jgi:hypothetical protein
MNGPNSGLWISWSRPFRGLTVDFVNSWLRLVFEGNNLAAIGEDGAAQSLIRDRERYF